MGWFRRHYPDTNETSLRTHIQFATSNVSDRGAFRNRAPLITRIDRGLYVRACPDGVEMPERTWLRPSVAIIPADDLTLTEDAPTHAPEWHTEANIVGYVVHHLAVNRWSVRSVADTASKAHGVDIIAFRDGITVGVEVKGYPSRHYADPARAGQAKPTQPATQARVWYASALLAGMTLRAKEPALRSVIALPSFPTYAGLYANTASSLAACGIEVWWVNEDGTVSAASEAPT
jgi:hypothetical protein